MYRVLEVPRDADSPVITRVVSHGDVQSDVYATFLQLAGKNPSPDTQRYVMTGPDHSTIMFAG